MKKMLNQKKKVIIGAVLGLAVVVAVVAAVWKQQTNVQPIEEFAQVSGSKERNTAIEAQKSLYEQDLEFLEAEGIPVPDKTVDIAALQADTNEDIYAWVYIPDTEVDYPIMQHPDDNTYYLNRNVDLSEGYPGCIYTENYNSKYFTDHNTVLYGHNMKDGSMFGGLSQYLDDDYYEEHPYIYIYTADRLYAYEIYAAYQSDDSHLLLNYDTSDTDTFKNYLETSMSTAASSGIEEADWTPDGSEYVLTLSTCTATGSSYRFLVQGKLVMPS